MGRGGVGGLDLAIGPFANETKQLKIFELQLDGLT